MLMWWLGSKSQQQAMTHQTNCATFHGEKDLAICSSNGILHLWDVTTGAKKVEFTPASHLTSSFTCLSWKIQQKIATKKQNGKATKRKQKTTQTDSSEEILAIGTASGEVDLYDVKAGDLIGKFTGEHSDKVNCVCWDPSGQRLLSCSEDQHIVHWDIFSYKSICKWRGDKRGVSSISVGPHNTLLSAGKMIKLWDLETKALLKKFSGHASPVISVIFVNRPIVPTGQDAAPLEMMEGSYFLSAAKEDRVVSVWQVQRRHKKIAVASFALSSEPVSMALKSPTRKEKSITLMVLIDSGELNIFSHVLNGQLKKPLDVQMTLTIVDPSAKKLRIMSATFCNDPDSETATILVAYGTTLKVIFERINLDDHATSAVVLIRQDPMKIDVATSENSLMTRQPIRKSSEVTLLAPGVPGHAQKSIAQEKEFKPKNKRKKMVEPALNESEMTMEQRVYALSARSDVEGAKSQPPKADSLSVLLTQGLQSGDREILNRVLQNTNDMLIHNTVARLPLSLVVPLVQDLTTRLRTSPAAAFKFMKWLRETLKVHSSYLMTFPDLVPVLSQLYQMMEARTETQKRFMRLEGKLELITSQIKAKKSATAENKAISKTAMCVYEDESSDEQEDVLLDDLPEEHSDSDDASGNEWDDLAEMEIDEKDEMMDEYETDSGVANGLED